ncbi:MAG TPA: ABC transporter permease subunit [Planctomycetota bacterium]|nr:ABC transporter permease subunit [Planctomycetota bacterium]
MVIHDRSYSRWKGDRSRPVAAFAVILRAGLRRSMSILFRRKLPALAMLLGAYGMFVFALGFLIVKHYVMTNAGAFPEAHEFLQNDEVAQVFSAQADKVYWYMLQMQAIFVVLTCVLLGAPLIAEDRRSNALELYFSRPVSISQYLLGKLAIIGTLIAAVTVIPAALLLFFDASLTAGDPAALWPKLKLLGRTLLAGAVLVAIPSLLILAASSLTERARNAAILFMAFVVMLELVVSNILVEVFSAPYFHLLQVGFNISQVAAWLLGAEQQVSSAVPVWLSALALAAWVAVLVPLLVRRVRPVEVVA